jgi:hypothetical protein
MIHYKKLNKNVLNYNDNYTNKMKDSGWIYIKDTLTFPIRFMAEISFTPFYKSSKTKMRTRQTQNIKNKNSIL